MSSFTRPLSITQVSVKPRSWLLIGGFRYYFKYEGSPWWVEALPGFVCDGGSIPRIVWWLDSPIGDGAQAYFLHDLLYSSELVSRQLADEMLMEGLEVLGMGWTRRRIIYDQVRLWGWMVWKEHTKESVAEARSFVTCSPELLLLSQSITRKTSNVKM